MAKKVKPISISDLNKIPMWKTLKTPYGFEIRRVLGGFMYEYKLGPVVFVSTDELTRE
jgi:hypothetical protein